MHGKGIYTYQNGDISTGKWKNNIQVIETQRVSKPNPTLEEKN